MKKRYLHFTLCVRKLMRYYARFNSFRNSTTALSDHASNEFERMKPVCLTEESLSSGLVDWR